MKAWKHFCTITRHKLLVMRGCFSVGLYRQGLMHDMTKYGYTEFWLGCKYYLGTESPHNGERRAYGYSLAWLHHKGCNKHHMEYWTDCSINKDEGIIGIKMPKKYVVEMFVDRVSASKNYLREQYADGSPWEYYDRNKGYYIMHPDTRALLESLLWRLKEQGEKNTFSYIKNTVLKIDFDY